LGDLVGVHAAHSFAPSVNLQHNARGRRAIHAEDAFQHIHDELHRRVVVVQQDHLIKRRSLEFRLGDLFDQLAPVSYALVAHRHPNGLEQTPSARLKKETCLFIWGNATQYKEAASAMSERSGMW